MSNTLCAFAFAHTDIEPNGDIKFCCAATNGAHVDEQGRVYNIQTHSLKEAWNSPQLKQTRLEMIAGGQPDICRYCWSMENADNTEGSSVRLRASNVRIPLETIKDRIDYAKQNNGELNDDHLAFDFQISIGNLCNLACKMCNNGYSTQYQKFFSKHHKSPQEVNFVLGKELDTSPEAATPFGTTFDWPIKLSLEDIFKDHIPTAKLIFFTGGEPTLIPQVIDFIEHVAESPHKDDLIIWPSTNCTNINKNLLSTLSKFNHIWINMSLDGMDEMAHIQRTPSHWPSIEKNVDMLMNWVNSQRKLGQRIEINLLTTVTALNFHHVLDFWKYFDDRYSQNSEYYGATANLVLDRHTNFGIEIVPNEFIPMFKEKLESYAKSSSHHIKTNYRYYGKLLETTKFATDRKQIQHCLDKIQNYHPDLDIRQIYSIYYQ